MNKKLFILLPIHMVSWQLASGERSKSMFYMAPLDQLRGNEVNRSAERPIQSGIKCVVPLLTVQDSEQIVWMLNKNVLCSQTQTRLQDTWRYTCYVPQRSEYSATHRALSN